MAFELLVQHQLLAKKSKCVFVAKRFEYLGCYISAQGVSIDPRKVKAVRSWPEPQSVTQLRGFLGLAGYYRRFSRSYGVISKPLTDMLIKDRHVTTSPILILLYFSLIFMVETDACDMGIGAVKENKAVDALSRLPLVKLATMTLSTMKTDLFGADHEKLGQG
ncbi:putative mitochondrial protein AtMg00860 [Nicotiana tabacum]|uniref:Mitochondrial protein AtMg00860 n=1 Tax=Nicotiana tabacum TaxID=4097 RepID=A0AC58RSI2_TOBAC